MRSEIDLAEYRREIRWEVCRYCVECPPGGPPCAPKGKWCGVEYFLPELIEAIHGVRSKWVLPYLLNNRRRICEHCAIRETDCCPCPLHSLAPIIVRAVKNVDERRALQIGSGECN
jgi:hypothetical protein